MFSLLVSIVSIALVIVLALATLYYGGDAMLASGPKAQAARLTSEAEQLRLAIQMYVVDHNRLPQNLSELTADGKYLKDAPESWNSTSQFFTKSTYDVEKDTCLQFNTSRGIPFVPECTDEVYRNVTVCCRNSLMSTE